MSEGNYYSIRVPDAVTPLFDYFREHHAIQGIDPVVLIKWGILALMIILVAVWHVHQNKAFHEYIRNTKQRTPISDRLSQLAYGRSYELWALFLILVLTVVFYDTRVYRAESQLELARLDASVHQELLASFQRQLAAKLDEIDEMQGITEEKEAQLNAVKERYEELFVTYYYLRRCEAVTPADFHLMNAGLIHELTELNVSAGLRRQILTAAKGTHDEMYATAPCTTEAIAPMQEQISDYLDQIVTTLPDQ